MLNQSQNLLDSKEREQTLLGYTAHGSLLFTVCSTLLRQPDPAWSPHVPCVV